MDLLPAELLNEIFSQLRHHDLAQLVRVSRQFQAFIEPMLWTEIELHIPAYHHTSAQDDPHFGNTRLNRRYHIDAAGRSAYTHLYLREYAEKVNLFLSIFSEQSTVDPNRAKYLAGLVRWLCLPINRPSGIPTNKGKRIYTCNELTHFRNVEYLELTGYFNEPDGVLSFTKSFATFSKLRTLKLRGYLSPEFVRFACQHGSTIERLELSIIDRPIGGTDGEVRQNPPPPTSHLNHDNLTEEELNHIDDIDDFNHETIAPRPLACLTPEIISRFASLTHLRLCKPAEKFDDLKGAYWYMYHSKRSEKKALNEWASLLRASSTTLVHLTLDLRPVAEELELDNPANEEELSVNAIYMRRYCNGPGFHRFVEFVLPELLEAQEWPSLKTIHLAGFVSDKVRATEDRNNSHEVRRGIDLLRRLKARFPNVGINSSLGYRFTMDRQTGEIAGAGDIFEEHTYFMVMEDWEHTYFMMEDWDPRFAPDPDLLYSS